MVMTYLIAEINFYKVDEDGKEIKDENGNTKLFITANTDPSKEAKHNLKINDKNYEWSGSYYFK